ncbi:BTB/POZ and MATH domain-containing protein 1-like [Lolium rigidum]|uniref:BTB/POZ and MATH domain-containing protein 1-like n=1 Tax=Lolium rigidum TaxID=89674 RepID=UPI001F5CA55E|nr:BTB/POZ and MATH domain-containing protein 1-like [Lolium rigidum]
METACAASLTDAARLVQLLKIDGYYATNAMDSTTSLKSRWTVDGYEWETRIYPNYESSVALELVFLGQTRSDEHVRASLGCRLVDPRGILKPYPVKSASTKAGGLFQYGTCQSKLSLVTRRDLEASGYLRDDALILECTITVLKVLPLQTFPAKETPIPAVPSSNLHAHFGELMQSGAGADVTFLVAGESFMAHNKAVLAARSPVFMAEFFGQMVEKGSEHVQIKDMEASVFKALLQFIYTDTAPDFDQQQKEEAAVMAQPLLAAADRYGMDRLKLICGDKLAGGIDVGTAVATLALAEQHGCEQLKDRCIEFIVNTPEGLDAVLATEGYKHLEASCPSVLTDLLVRGRNMLKRT